VLLAPNSILSYLISFYFPFQERKKVGWLVDFQMCAWEDSDPTNRRFATHALVSGDGLSIYLYTLDAAGAGKRSERVDN
jgi:hypothetical protein